MASSVLGASVVVLLLGAYTCQLSLSSFSRFGIIPSIKLIWLMVPNHMFSGSTVHFFSLSSCIFRHEKCTTRHHICDYK